MRVWQRDQVMPRLAAIVLLLAFDGCKTTPVESPAAAQPELLGTLLRVDEDVPSSAKLEAMVAPYRREVGDAMREVLAQAPELISRGRPEGALGNLVVDAMREAAGDVTSRPVDLAFTNAGGLRNDIPAGPVTIGSIFEVMPFDNTLVVFEVSGEDLQKILNSAAARGGDPISGGRLVIESGRATKVTVGGAAIDPKKTYRVCTNDYVFEGGGRFNGLRDAKAVVQTGALLRDLLVDFVRRHAVDGTFRYQADGRVSGETVRRR